MEQAILVCGGAGYIGSHMVRLLRERGLRVVVFDNLSLGHAAAVGDTTVVEGDLLDRAALEALFGANEFSAVYHFAALSSVGESMAAPDRYYRNNVCGTLNLLDAMRGAGVDRIVFSSTAAVYGDLGSERLVEADITVPINPYGRSKLMIEQALADHAAAYGLRSVSFRYFNAAGADPSGEIGEAHDPETHLVPNALLAALGWMDAQEGAHVFNLGNGTGFSIREVIEAARLVTGRDIPVRLSPRRPGDAAVLVADSTRAREDLGWRPDFPDLESILRTAWQWHRAPGYGACALTPAGRLPHHSMPHSPAMAQVVR